MALKIESRAGIAAPVDDVWEVIQDVAGWPSWSPIHKATTGTLGFGAPIHLEEYYKGLGTWTIDGAVDDWVPLSHIHIGVPKPFYAGRLIRYFEMEALTETGSTFTVGALFDGYLSEREGKRFKRFLKEGFEDFAEAVRVRAEAHFAENPAIGRSAPKPLEAPVAPQLAPTRPDWTPTKFLWFGKGSKF